MSVAVYSTETRSTRLSCRRCSSPERRFHISRVCPRGHLERTRAALESFIAAKIDASVSDSAESLSGHHR
jgi:hypothetical protein